MLYVKPFEILELLAIFELLGIGAVGFIEPLEVVEGLI